MFTVEEKKLLENLLGSISVKPTSPDALKTVTLIQSISDKLKEIPDA